MLGVRRTWPLAAGMSARAMLSMAMFALAMTPATARAAKPDACASRAAVSVELAPLELSGPPEKPERLYPQAARRDGVTGYVVLQCNAAGGALNPCAVDEESPAGEGFAASALKLAKSLIVRTGPVAQIVKVAVRFDLEPPSDAACRPGETSAMR